MRLFRYFFSQLSLGPVLEYIPAPLKQAVGGVGEEGWERAAIDYRMFHYQHRPFNRHQFMHSDRLHLQNCFTKCLKLSSYYKMHYDNNWGNGKCLLWMVKTWVLLFKYRFYWVYWVFSHKYLFLSINTVLKFSLDFELFFKFSFQLGKTTF